MIGALAVSRLPNRLSVRLARMQSCPEALVWRPEPPNKGDAAAGRRLLDGILLFSGRLVETDRDHPWEISSSDPVWLGALHGHAWLDDIAAAEDPAAWALAQRWVWSWIETYHEGEGPGWQPEFVARRLTRWIAHSANLLMGQSGPWSQVFFKLLGTQLQHLNWRWHRAVRDIDKIEALCGLLYATLCLEGEDSAADRIMADLGVWAERVILPDGGVASRSPQDLAQVLAHLAWIYDVIEELGLRAPIEVITALKRGAPALGAVRFSNGRLARFHGAEATPHLANVTLPEFCPVGVETASTNVSAMGFARLSGGTSELILDGAAPASGLFEQTCHASAMAFELQDSGHPVIANCGPGAAFGAKFADAARRGPAHSTLEVAGRCAASLKPGKIDAPTGRLIASGTVRAVVRVSDQQNSIFATSTQYQQRFGLVCQRQIDMTRDGRRITGEDVIRARSPQDRDRFASAFPHTGPPCTVIARFHLHPDVMPALALSGKAVSLTLPGETTWVLRADPVAMELEPSVYFDHDRPTPRATQQIVVRTDISEYLGRISWSLERLPDL